ncbi:uncharacterized protein LOC114533972 [Dendronephthya gigantea]|uniref:uncharacterized protein LOC114533972 n=1 Tax=Dendronephthya gigantea TaxID=151771 RepID=UPI00106BA830|nr:uncharacterized protein LOC114533972 [Dendronephthya gigantea]
MDAVSFVESLELHEGSPMPMRMMESFKSTLAEKKKAKAFVDAGSLVSFTENLSGQNKEDVLNSTLLAQLAASKKHDRQTDSANWYKFYTDVLMKIGWVTQQFQFSKYHSHTGSFEMSTVVLDILLSLVGDGEQTLVDVVKATLESFKKSGGDTIKLFDHNCVSGQQGNFQIIPCTVDKKSGQVVVKFVGAYFKATKVDSRFLFFTYSNSQVDLEKAADSLTLNEKIYSKVRQAIIDKLGGKAQTFVDGLDI